MLIFDESSTVILPSPDRRQADPLPG